jgi:hypothetical protein
VSASSDYAAAQKKLLLGAIKTIPKVKEEMKAKKDQPKKTKD